MFCCNALENLINSAGERGFAILVSAHPDGIKFSLQMRSMAFIDEKAFPSSPLPMLPTNLSLSGSIRIRYCPSCGRRLQELVEKDIKCFSNLAEHHKEFQNNWGV